MFVEDIAIQKLSIGFRRVSLLTTALLLALSSLLSIIRFAPVHADDMITNTYDTDTQLNSGIFNQTAVSGTGSSAYAGLCHGGPACDQNYVPVTINNTSGPAMSSPLVHITVNTAALITAGKMQGDCGDIRFMDTDQTTELTNGRVDACNTTHTDVQLILPSIAAASSRTIYMYYGSLNPVQPLHGGRVNLDNTMATNPSPPASLQGDAIWDSVNGYVQLTAAENGQSGALEYMNNPGNNFDFSTQFYSGGGNGADAIYLYMGTDTTPTTENDSANGYIFAYDEYQHYIGVLYNGHVISAVYCASPSQINQPDTTGSDLHQSSTACHIDDSTWHTARIVRTDNNIKMYLDGSVIIDYTSGSLPQANGPLMGWGARTGGMNNFHRIRNLTLDIGEGNVISANNVSLGSESSAASNFPSDGSWATPIFDMQKIAVWADESMYSPVISGSLSSFYSGDTATLQIKQAETVADMATATPKTLQTIYGDNGGYGYFSRDYEEMGQADTLPYYNGSVVQFIITIHRASEDTPHLDNFSYIYTPHHYGPPSAPLNLSVVSADGRIVNAYWDPPVSTNNGEIDQYLIEYKRTGDSWANEIGASDNSGTSMEDIGLFKLGENYTFRVKAHNLFGWSDYSDEVIYGTPTPTTHHITDCQQLQDIGNNDSTWGDLFVLDNDIDCTETSGWNGGAGFLPIAPHYYSPFYGTLDGKGHTIKNLYINSAVSETGLFSHTDFATFKDLNFTGGSVTSASDNVGLLAGYAGDDTTIINVTSSVPVTGVSSVGGLIGYTDKNFTTPNTITVTNSSTSGNVSSNGNGGNIGGLIGVVKAYNLFSMTGSHSSSTISGTWSSGGLVGDLFGVPVVSDSYATGNIISSAGGEYMGGLIGNLGYNDGSSTAATFTNVYATGNVLIDGGAWGIGGLVGDIYGRNHLSFNKVYATGNVVITNDVGSQYLGGLFGYAGDIALSNAYATGNITAPNSSYIGGLIGGEAGSRGGDTITNTYASGNVQGADTVGGLIGYATADLSNSFATGIVSSTDTTTAAGLVANGYVCADDDGCTSGFSSTNNYYDQVSTGQNNCINAWAYSAADETMAPTTVSGCTPIAQTGYFVNKSSGPLFGTWNFTDVWVKHLATLPTFSMINETAGDNSGGVIKKKTTVTTSSAAKSDDPTATEDETTSADNYILLNDFNDYVNTADPGHKVNLTVGQVVHFTKDGEQHTATVKFIGSNYVILTVASTPFDVTVSIGQTQLIDVDKDGKSDISVRLNSIDGGIANMTFKQLKNIAIAPNTGTVQSAYNWWWLVAIAILVIVLWISVRRLKQTKDNA